VAIHAITRQDVEDVNLPGNRCVAPIDGRARERGSVGRRPSRDTGGAAEDEQDDDD